MKKIALFLCMVLTVISLAGCSGNGKTAQESSEVSKTSSVSEKETAETSEKSEDEAKETEETSEEALPVIGAEGEGAFSFVLTNELGDTITEISVALQSAEFTDADKINMNGVQIESGNAAAMYYTPAQAQTAESTDGASADGSDTAAQDSDLQMYKLKVVTALGNEYTVLWFPVSDVQEFSICPGGDAEFGAFAYLKYKRVSTGEEVSTQTDQLSYMTEQKAAEEQAAAEAAAAEQAAAEQAAAEQAAAEQAAAEAAAEQAAAEAAAAEQAAAEAAAAQAAAEEAARQEAAAQQQAQQDAQDCANILG